MEIKNVPLDSGAVTAEQNLYKSQSSEAQMKKKNLFRIWNRNPTATEQNNKKKEPGKIKTILKSLRYLNKKDTIILFLKKKKLLSFLAAIGNGFLAPYNVACLLTPLLTIFIKVESSGNVNNVNMTEVSSKFVEYGYEYFIIGIMNFTFGFIQIMASETVSRNIMAKIKTAYLSKMLSIEVGRYDKLEEKFVSTMSHDLQKMTVLFDSKMTSAVDMLTFFVFGCVAGFIVSWKVASLTFVLMLIAIAVIYFIMQASKKVGNMRQQYNGKCTKIISEVLGNTRTVAAYGGEYKEIERYKNIFKMSNKYGLKHATVISLGKAFNYFQLCICYMVAYYFSVRLYLADDFDPGYIAIILSAQINAIYHCTYLLTTVSEIFIATDSAYRVVKFIDTETSYSESIEQGIMSNTFEANVSFRNVQFSYPTNLQTQVIHNLTLDIEPGKVTAVVGTSGAGKSTIVSLISRLYDVTNGQILIGGVDIRKLNVSWLRNQISVVSQEPMLFDTSIEENIRYGKTTATLNDIIEAAKISYAHGFIEKLPLGYDSIVGERGTKLSVGQKQRIAIARAIVRKPKLLILDEATSALDLYSEGIVQEAIDNAMIDRTTLIIAHRMSTVRNADVIYVINEGHVVEKGSHSKLMELNGYYYSLVKVQELEEKDKAVTLTLRNAGEEEFIDEELVYDKNFEVSESIEKLRFSKKNIKVMIVWFLAVLFTIIMSAFLPTFFYIYTLFFQSYTYTKDELHRIALIDSGILFGLGLIAFFSTVLSGVMSTLATQFWLKKLQQKAFNKIVSMDISWFDWSGNSPNECLEVLTNSPPLIESVTGDKASQVVIFMLSLLFSLGYSFFINTNLTLANLPIILSVIIINGMRIRSRVTDTRSASIATRSTKVAIEYVQNINTIQMLNCQKYVINKYQNMLTLSKKEEFVSIVWYAVVYGLSKTLIRLSMGTTFIMGAKDIADGNIQGTSLIGIISAISFTCMLAGPALILMSQYPAARQAITRLNRIAYPKTFLSILSDKGINPEICGNIVFQDVTFSYPTRNKVKILKKLNLKIEAGKTIALIGDSGCGKSTIISLLERFYLPDEGRILIDGIDINDINVRYLRSQMGLVLQEPVLFNMTIKENIIYGLEEEVTMDRIIEAAKIANIHDFIMTLPLAYDISVGEKGSKLSSGQKQRIAIARAVLRNPKILLLDEPTSALDTENEKAVQKALENVSIGKTTIVISHRLSTIRKADKIIVLQSGEVIEEGNHEQLMEKRGHYFNLLSR
ncbi:ATP-dependent translocase ABCB1 [Halyomorpha halys]|uniref:ATP-dependent translocase ABCB1 n=1 Tax=Halyomorpha halys TaxID=286706 RepID=UPI0034D1EF36